MFAEAYDANKNGEVLYKSLANDFGSPKAASELFAGRGVPGHRYLDQASRADGYGTHNYVVYTDAIIRNETKPSGSVGMFGEDVPGAYEAKVERPADFAAEPPLRPGFVRVYSQRLQRGGGLGPLGQHRTKVRGGLSEKPAPLFYLDIKTTRPSCRPPGLPGRVQRGPEELDDEF